MHPELSRTQAPEQQELGRKKSELVALEATLAQQELDLATLQATLHAVEARYVRIVGVCYAELDELEAQIAEAQAQRYRQDGRLHQQAADARAKAAESAAATDAVRQVNHDAGFSPPDDLRKLYRDIARRIHPDLTTDANERVRRHRVMAEANRAYAEGDDAKLRALLDDWHSSPDSVEGEGIGAELVRTIRKIHQVQRRLADISAEINELNRSDLYALKKEVEAAQRDGKDLLAHMAEQVRAQIALARKRLEQI